MFLTSSCDFSPKQEEILFGRLGLIKQSLASYNKQLPRDLLKTKYLKMGESPFSFFRGTNHLYWMDFEWDWRMTRFGNYRTRTWLNGDCHVYNFGAYQTHEGKVIYGLNDFDESVIEDYQYDLWRLAISLALIPEETYPKNYEFPKVKLKKVLDALSSAYLKTSAKFSGSRKADQTAYHAKNTAGLLKKFLQDTTKKESRAHLLDDWTVVINGKRLFNRALSDVQDLKKTEKQALFQMIKTTIPDYVDTINKHHNFHSNYFQVLDIVRRVNAGTGSLGVDRFYILIQGNHEAEDGQVILDMKEIWKPSAYPHATDIQKVHYHKQFPHEGIRYTAAYRALDYQPDNHLGWVKFRDKVYSVRERNPYKKSFKMHKYINSEKDYVEMASYWGQILATEHARANKANHYSLGKEIRSLTKGKSKEFKQIVREVAVGYASVVKSDYALFKAHFIR